MEDEVELTEEDLEWCKTRAIELMDKGLPLVDAIECAAKERAHTLATRELIRRLDYADALDRERDRFLEAQRKQQAKDRAEWAARATPGQRPTLKTSFGDLLKMRGRR